MIRLHKPLSQILIKPSLYIEKMSPPDLVRNLQKIADIRAAETLKQVDSLQLWPDANSLVLIDRKFGMMPS
jgi:hypothetical protein